MAIKTSTILTREDYNEAQVTLGLTYAEVGKETSIPRQYLSEFRNGTRNLLPEHQRKVRSFFEDRGIVFEDGADEENEAQQDEPRQAVNAQPYEEPEADPLKDCAALRSAKIACLHFSISPALDATEVRKIAREIDANESELEKLLGKKAETGFLSDWSGETESDIQAAISLMAANYVLHAVAQGKSFVYRDTPEGEDAQTVRDVLNDTFAIAFTGFIAGLVNAKPDAMQGEPVEAATDAGAAKEQAWL